MQSQKKIRIILLFALLLLFACEKEEDPNNQLVIDGVEYPLSWGLYFLDGFYGDSNYSVYLLSSGVQINSEDNLSGSGNFIMIDGIFSSSGNLPGTYHTWDTYDFKDYVPDTFGYLSWYLDCNLPFREKEDYGIFDWSHWASVSGELKITSAGNIYEIKFEGQLMRQHPLPHEKSVTLYYKGPLIER